MKQSRKNNVIYKRIILPYVGIVLASFLMLLIIVTFFMGRIGKESLRNQEQNMIFYSHNADNIINNMNNITTQICFNSTITNPQNHMTPIGRMKVIETISDFTVNLTSTNDLLLFSDNSEYIYSRESTYTKELIDKIYHFESEENIFDKVLEVDELTMFPAVNLDRDGVKKCVIPVVFPNAKKSFGQKLTLLYLIEEEQLLNRSGIDNHIFIIDNENGVVLSGKNEEISRIDTEQLNNNKKIKINNKKYYPFMSSSDIVDISYLMLIPVNAINAKVYSLWIVFVLILSGLMLGGLMVWNNIKNDFSIISGIIGSLENLMGKNYNEYDEFKVIEDDVLGIMNSINETKRFNEENKDFFKAVFLERILHGEYDDVKYINTFQFYSNIYFRFDTFYVVSFLFEKENPGKDIGMFEQYEKSSNECDIFFKKGNKLNIVYAIISARNEFDIEAYVEKIRRDLAEKFGCAVTAGLSNSTQDISDIWKNYIQSDSVLEYRLVMGEDRVLKFSSFDIEPNNSLYPVSQIQALGGYIEQGQTDKINFMIDEIFNYARNSSNLYMARYLCFDVIATVMRHISITTGKTIDVNAVNIMKFDTIEKLVCAVKEYCIRECQETGNENDLFAQIVEFIKKNYMRLDFSIKTIIEEFDISQTNLYSIFKENLSITPLQYINNLQMEAVKDMLINTKLSISEIVHNIGRQDTSNFIRKFKVQTGMTPGEFRKYYATK